MSKSQESLSEQHCPRGGWLMRYGQNIYVSIFYNAAHVDYPHFTQTVTFSPALDYF